MSILIENNEAKSDTIYFFACGAPGASTWPDNKKKEVLNYQDDSGGSNRMDYTNSADYLGVTANRPPRFQKLSLGLLLAAVVAMLLWLVLPFVVPSLSWSTSLEDWQVGILVAVMMLLVVWVAYTNIVGGRRRSDLQYQQQQQQQQWWY